MENFIVENVEICRRHRDSVSQMLNVFQLVYACIVYGCWLAWFLLYVKIMGFGHDLFTISILGIILCYILSLNTIYIKCSVHSFIWYCSKVHQERVLEVSLVDSQVGCLVVSQEACQVVCQVVSQEVCQVSIHLKFGMALRIARLSKDDWSRASAAWCLCHALALPQGDQIYVHTPCSFNNLRCCWGHGCNMQSKLLFV